jgi:hypothetical protein
MTQSWNPPVKMSGTADVVSGRHPYPSAYGPGTHWAIDEAWAILDRLPSGLLPDDQRFLMAGQIAGAIMKHAKRR